MADAKTNAANPSDPYQPTSAPQKILRINPMALVSMFMTGNEIGVKNGVDEGTRYVGGGFDPQTNTFYIHVENDNYEEIKIGEKLPPVLIELVDLKQSNLDGTPKAAPKSILETK